MRYKSRNSSGFALFLTMGALVVMIFLLTTNMQRTQVDTSLAGSWNRRARASGVADTGMSIVARKILDYFIAHNTINTGSGFTTYLGTAQMGSTNGGTYSVLVTDNDYYGSTANSDENGNAVSDADNTFRLVATGLLGASEQVIDAYFKVVPGTSAPPPDSSGIGAVGICTDNVDITNGASIQGADWNLPSYGCSGASCSGTASSNPASTGLSYNTGTVVDISGTPAGSPGTNSNAAIDCTSWEAFTASTAAISPTTLSASDGPFNASAVASQFGTDSDPKVIVINGPGTAQFNGNLYGNGILIINNANVVFNGTFTYAGLILITDDGGGISVGGTSQIFGTLMVMDGSTTDSQTELSLGKKTPIHYSTQGLAKAASALAAASGSSSTSLTTIAWRVSDI